MRYNYTCAGCGGPVTKTPCHTEQSGENAKKQDYCGLHGWQCQKCGLGRKVNRTMRRAQ